MAQRLATVYVQTRLTLSETEMMEFAQWFAEQQINMQVKVTENGNHEMSFADDLVQEGLLTFERVAGGYLFHGTCRFTNPKLANAMRKAVSMYKGDAIVHRIYAGYTMVYHYVGGTAIKIIESKAGEEKLVYEYKDTLGQLQRLFDKNHVEAAIQVTNIEINELLDARIVCTTELEKAVIDRQLAHLTKTLFTLEA
ncbi:hypothetical protein SY83_13730 [Paenibacillus swuensis]|uniref:Non-ribosomal peptide synthetase module n=1 Tax=Paenibacillus swuensis TaxID=1178515 RepID=A0A172TJD8_9BACL|nr:hypothetical protein [Paenibacillus swuensis]ANE47148.1 hypothetical protein SY83_13730 [Paenibacillus swuensis]